MAGQEFSGPSAREISAMLNDAADSLAPVLLPGGVMAGGYYHMGSVRGDRGDSLKINITKSPKGAWADYACDERDPEGKGDMLKLVQLTVGEGDMGRALKWARGWLGIESMDPAVLERQRKRAAAAQQKAEMARAGEVDKSRLRARNLWQNAAPIIGTPAIRYLEGRDISFAAIGKVSGALRFCHNVWHGERREPLPAMLIAGTALDGTHICTHATYLERHGDGRWTKIPDMVDPKTGEMIKVAKKIFGKDWHGAHFPLHKGSGTAPLKAVADGTPLAVSEGAEDALTFAMMHPDRRVAMAGTVANIGLMAVPPQCGDLTILAQHDAPGSKAALSLEKQLARQQQLARTQGSRRRVMCLWPGAGFKDLNDELRGIRM